MTKKEALRLFKSHARAKGYYQKVRGFNAYRNTQEEMMTLIGHSNGSIRIFVNNEHINVDVF